MKKSISLLLLSLLMITPSCQKPKEVTNEYNIVPQPNQLVPKEGRFELSNKVRLVVPSDAPEVKKVADGFAEQLKQTAGISLKEAESVDGKPAISFVLQEGMPKEGYKLSVTPTLITVTASQPNGFFYGVQTIYQLLPPAVYGKELKKKADWSVPAVEIEDAPRFVHRGLMLDVCRHYAPIEYIYKFIDLLAMNKMNVFHWHLTDDQGWRIEIKKYPKLTEIGSKREKTLVDYYYVNYPQVFDGIEHGGYYTQEQIKEVVAYAASKYINVIPEIEMPGHALAALAAYPELSCDSTQTYKVSPTWGVFEQVFCPSETTFKFFEGVMDEVVELFPSEYIHIGGDECPKTAWKNSAFCQQLIRQLGLKDDVTPSKVDGMKHSKEDKLQSYFVTRMEKYLNGKGRNIIGWDEILEGGLAPNATVLSWRGVEGGLNAAKAGHNAIMAPMPYAYLDFYQEDPEIAPTTIGGYTTLKKHSKEDKLQSYFVTRMEKYLNGKGRNIIGWDEILEGGLAPNATVLSWRGVEGGLNAAKAGHNAIMAPMPYAYLDFYQEDPEIAPTTIGGYTTLKKTYSYNPVPDDADELVKKHIIGMQGNLWREYMKTSDRVDYQAFPRAMAIAETGWTLDANKNWKSFCERMVTEFERLEVMDTKPCLNFFDVNINTHADENGPLMVLLETFYPNAEIRYTTDGSEPTYGSTLYEQPFALEGNIDLKAAAFKDGKMLGKVTNKPLYGNLLAGKPFTVNYTMGWTGDIFGDNDVLGADKTTFGLTNGKRGNNASYTPWSSFAIVEGKDLEFIVHLDKPTEVRKVVFGSLFNPAMRMLPAGGVAVEVSADGQQYTQIAEKVLKHDCPETGRIAFTDSIEFEPTQATFLKVKIKNGGTLRNGVNFEKNNGPEVIPAELWIDEIEAY